MKLKPSALSLGLLIALSLTQAHSATPSGAGGSPKTPSTKDGIEADNRVGAPQSGITKDQYIAHLKKYGRPPNVPQMQFSRPSYTNSTWGFGEYRNWKKPRFHNGIDLGDGQKYQSNPNVHAGADSTSLFKVSPSSIYAGTLGTLVLQRTDDGGMGDRVVHLHLFNVSNAKQFKRGDVIGKYGSTGMGDDKSVHDHVKYSVKTSQSARLHRKGIDYHSSSALQAKKIEGTGVANDASKLISGQYTPTDATPYLPDIKRTYKNKRMYSYLGDTAYSKFNVLYGTQLPTSGMSAVTKQLPSTLLNQVNYSGMEVTQEMLQASGNTAISSAIYGEDGGFDFGSGQMMTQKMLASSFADDDGEMWQSVFGADEPANINEMTQAQLVKHMATRTYANADWLAKLNRLSTKGLVMEYLQQQAEINYMLAMLKDLKLQTIQQKALLARVSTVGQDKNLDGLADSIHVDYNPNFMDVDLLASGDEWIGSDMPSGGGGSGVTAPSLDLNNLPNDMKVLSDALLEAVTSHESNGSYNAFNREGCPGARPALYTGKDPHPFAPITNMRVSEILARYYIGGNPKNKRVGCDVRIFATGKYQTIPLTLHYLINLPQNKKYLNSPNTPEVQEHIAKSFFSDKRPLVGRFIRGDKSVSLHTAKLEMAKEWASIAAPEGVQKYKSKVKSRGCPSKNVCDTYYPGNNKAFYESTHKVWAILEKMEQVRNGGGANTTANTPKQSN